METIELREKIDKTLELFKNAKSISVRRRYFVYLSTLVATYNEITKENLSFKIGRTMKHTFYENFVKEISVMNRILAYISREILESRKEVGCEFRENYVIKTYKQKYLMEIFESFLVSLDEKFYKLYKEALKDDRLFYNKEFGTGCTVFDYQTLKSTVFVPYDRETLSFLVTFAHEMGHVFEYDFTKHSRKAVLANKCNANCEVFSMFVELLMIEYLKKNYFDRSEALKIEEKYYNDLIGFATELNYALSLSVTFIDPNCNLLIYDYDDANKCAEALSKKYGVSYYLDDINLENSFNYMFGGLIATIYQNYYNQDKNFFKEISNHILDYETYNTKEILIRLPFVRNEINDGCPILKKKLEQIKTNQF